VNVTLAADVNEGLGDSFPRSLTSFNGELFFSAAADGAANWELWVVEAQQVNQPPSVVIDSPANGATFPSDQSLTISVTATDDSSITVVEFYSDGALLGIDSTAPYSFTASFLPGNHILTAKATDNAGASRTSTAVSLNVAAPSQPPNVAITAPASGAIFQSGQSVTINATATDDSSVSKVEFFAEANLIGSDNTAPYSVSTTFAAGNHSITAKATDNQGLIGSSEPVSITVQQTNQNQPPTIQLTSEAIGRILLAPATAILRATATDQDGTISRVEFFKGQEFVGLDLSAPYELTLGDLPAGIHLFTADATDNEGATATSSAIELKVVDQPAITKIARSGNEVLLTVSGSDGVPVTLEASNDLRDWNPVASGSPVAGRITFNQPIEGSSRFYRIAIR
jgi:hypothetical protein